MTTIKIVRTNHKITYFSLDDHAGAGEQGNDMVCAILSTASQYAVLGLEEAAKIEAFTYTILDGFLECELSNDLQEDERKAADVLLETMVLVLRQAEEQFPQYLKIEESEV